jgi:RNA polymerase sigma-70 factor (ECF subfamily)
MPREPVTTDRDLVKRLRAGDADAFTFVYRRWQGPLFRFALHMSGSPALAEDATQEVFMTFIRQLGQFDDARGTLGAYLFGIARNHVRRRQQRERVFVSLDGGAQDSDGATTSVRDRLPHASQDDPVRLETIQRIRQAVLKLPEDFREVVALCDLEEMSYEEAAAALGCAVGTVASRLHRARALLAVRLRKSEVNSREPGFIWKERKVRNA